MTGPVIPISLWSVDRQEAVDAELVGSISEKNLDDWQQQWLPQLFQSVMNIQRTTTLRPQWPQSHRWDWRAKAEALRQLLAHRGFAVISEGVTQGMMIVDLTTRRCRLAAQEGKDLVYVNFIENAPWNRPELVSLPRFRGVGSVLMRAAVELSVEEEFKGRVGLHSLPQANSFYANTCCMTDCGPDPGYQGLRYFEMTPEQAEEFISRGKES